MYDVAIVGAGIAGCCIARELSKTNARVVLLEKENDVACGSSKANSGIVHAGYDPIPDTLMASFNIRGAELYPELAKKLDFPYEENGSLVIAFDEAGAKIVQELYERGKQNGVKQLEVVDAEKLHELEPSVSENAVCALYAPTAGIISPYETTWAFAESAVINGVTLLRGAMVHKIERVAASAGASANGEASSLGTTTAASAVGSASNGHFLLHTGKGIIEARFVINAAGIASDKVSELAGARKFSIVQRRGEYCLLDKKYRSIAKHVLFQTPTALGKGVLVTHTIDGNILVGPSADGQISDGYTGTTESSQANVWKQAELTVPDLPRGAIINSFSGIRALAFVKDTESGEEKSLEDFIVEEDANVHGFFNVAGICSPGLTAAPAIAEYVLQLLKGAGLDTTLKTNFIEERHTFNLFNTASEAEKVELIKKNPLYGRIICRCEMITEAEIVASIHCPVGAVDLDGVKRRTRSGMGRCQGGFCSPRVTEIISRELNIPMTAVTKRGGASFVLTGRTRDVEYNAIAKEEGLQ